MKVGERVAKVKGVGKGKCGVGGFEHFRFPGEQENVGSREGKVKGLGKGKCGVGRD